MSGQDFGLPVQQKGIVAILPLSMDDSALDQLDSTLKTLIHGGALARDEHGKVEVDGAGYVRAEVADQNFVVFAIKKQGYALKAIALPIG